MAWLATNKNGDEYIYDLEPERYSDVFVNNERYSDSVKLPQGSIEKLIGKSLTWADEPFELTESKDCTTCKYYKEINHMGNSGMPSRSCQINAKPPYYIGEDIFDSYPNYNCSKYKRK